MILLLSCIFLGCCLLHFFSSWWRHVGSNDNGRKYIEFIFFFLTKFLCVVHFLLFYLLLQGYRHWAGLGLVPNCESALTYYRKVAKKGMQQFQKFIYSSLYFIYRFIILLKIVNCSLYLNCCVYSFKQYVSLAFTQLTILYKTLNINYSLWLMLMTFITYYT